MKKVLTVLGARPHFIKSQPLSSLLKKHKYIKEVIVHTGQHYDFRMYKFFLKELHLPKPDYFLGIKPGDNMLQVSQVLGKLNDIINYEKPDLTLVYGDVNSTLGAALAAKDKKIPLGHIEAGLRSLRRDMAEELNRVITDRISDLLFAPTTEAVDNLKKEKITEGVHLTGDVLYDMMVNFKEHIEEAFKEIKDILHIDKNDYYFFTLHRAQTVDNPLTLKLVLETVSKLNHKTVFPIHPRTQRRIREFKLEKLLKNIHCIEPQPYKSTLALIKNSKAVLTDSGGVQREAYMLKIPCVTLRNETEWNQTLEYGWNRLIAIDDAFRKKLPEILKNISLPNHYRYIFGDGKACVKILKIIETFLLG
ncbi:MAG: UDP-N-acetylglucosamine 2-epimerase (non-hydrolyzing) [Candidatus Omnitrophica bacterium]|nr:UDP-N-acetylglucosamine 2-epimerase (non-hydrolyzing) [Candidatus Omnitrophota bacterium]